MTPFRRLPEACFSSSKPQPTAVFGAGLAIVSLGVPETTSCRLAGREALRREAVSVAAAAGGGGGKGLVLRLFPSSRYLLDDMGQQCAEGQG